MFITTSYLCSIGPSFINGGQSSSQSNVTPVKKYTIQGKEIPYVSAQAMRKMIRKVVNHLTDDFSYYERIRKTPSSKEMKEPEGKWVDPVYYIEDDLFGFSHPKFEKIPKSDDGHQSVASVNRLSPFQLTSLVGLPNSSTIQRYDGWVKPGMNSSLPFENEIMMGNFQGSAILDLSRIGVFREYGDIVEIDPILKSYYLDSTELIEVVKDGMLEVKLSNLQERRQDAANLFFDSLMNTYGAAKSTLFATDLTPRIFIIALTESGNNLFYNIVKDKSNGELIFDLDTLHSRISNNIQSIKSDVFIGYRSGTVNLREEQKLLELDQSVIQSDDHSVKIIVASPGEAILHVKSKLEELQ